MMGIVREHVTSNLIQKGTCCHHNTEMSVFPGSPPMLLMISQ